MHLAGRFRQSGLPSPIAFSLTEPMFTLGKPRQILPLADNQHSLQPELTEAEKKQKGFAEYAKKELGDMRILAHAILMQMYPGGFPE